MTPPTNPFSFPRSRRRLRFTGGFVDEEKKGAAKTTVKRPETRIDDVTKRQTTERIKRDHTSASLFSSSEFDLESKGGRLGAPIEHGRWGGGTGGLRGGGGGVGDSRGFPFRGKAIDCLREIIFAVESRAIKS